MVAARTFVRWRDDPRGPYIRLHSGREFHLRNPQAEEMYVPDMAYHLAGINRYTGGSRFSDAQHMAVGAIMAERFYRGEELLPARVGIHDAAEFAYGDVSSPLKFLLPGYKDLQDLADLQVERRFDLTFVGNQLVKEVDVRMWLTEREVVFSHVEDDISCDYEGPLEPFPLDQSEIRQYFDPWSPERAEEEWMLMVATRLPWVRW